MNTVRKMSCEPYCETSPTVPPESRRPFYAFIGGLGLLAALSLGLPRLLGAPLSQEREIFYLLMTTAALGLGYFAPSARIPGIDADGDRSGKVTPLDLSFGIAALAVLVGTALRFYGIDFDFPLFYHPDEARKVRVVQRMIDENTLDPNYFLHPTLLLYGTYGFAEIFQWLGVPFEKDAFRIALGGRFVSALLGSFSIVLVYAIAKRLFSRPTGAIAALLFAVMPLHITCSRYLKEDVIFSTFGLLALLFVVRAAQERRPREMLLAGFFAGMSMGSKYTGVLSFALLCTYPFLLERKFFPSLRSFLPIVWAALAMPVGFLICTPYSIFNFEKFWTDFSAEGKHVARGHGGISISAWSQLWMYHLSRSITRGATFIPLFVGLLGFGMFLRRRRIEDLVIIAGFLLYYLPAEFIKAKPMPQPDRYILPVLAFLAIGAAEYLRLSCRCSSRWVVALVIASIPFQRSIGLASELYTDTRLQMTEWVNENIPRGADIVVVGEVKYLPRLSPSRYKLKLVGTSRTRDRLTVPRLVASPHQYLLSTSLSSDRYVYQPNADPEIRQRFLEYDAHFETVKVMKSKYGSYGFHNPVLTLYRITKEAPQEATKP